MKKLLPLIFLFLLLGSYQLLLHLPYNFYHEAINRGVNSEFLSLRKLPAPYYKGGKYKFVKMEGVATEEPRLWDKLHFDNFIMPFPLRHPNFRIAPIIDREAGKEFFGFKVLNSNKEELNSIMMKPSEEFSLEFKDHKIFELPLFKKRITMNGLSGPWIDLFFRDYSKDRYPTPPFGEVWNPFAIPVVHMVYDLFIIKSRERFFPADTRKIRYWEKKDFGVTEVTDSETKAGKPQQFREEYVFVLHENRVYRVLIRTRLEDYMAERYRQKFLDTLEFKPSHGDSSIGLYSAFKKLTYQEKLSPTGFTYLYAALSHKQKSREFLREMIQFLERGKNDRIYLAPLYDYAYQVYGSSFSKDMQKLKESQAEKLKRKISEETKKLTDRLKNEDFVEQRESFKNKDEKVKFYLQKAKDSGVDTSEDPNSAVMD